MSVTEWNVYSEALRIAADTSRSERDRVKEILSLGAGELYHGSTYTSLSKIIDTMYRGEQR